MSGDFNQLAVRKFIANLQSELSKQFPHRFRVVFHDEVTIDFAKQTLCSPSSLVILC